MLFKERRTCLVTGGAGFIGSHLVDRLIERGYRTVVIDNESTGFRENVNPEATYILGDITNTQDLRKAFVHDIDIVFHVAGQASTIKSFESPENDLNTNLQGSLNVLKMCLQYHVPRLLYASSMTVYGHPTGVPVAETESCSPISYYGVTKYAAERYLHITAKRTDLDFSFEVTSFRMFNVYGARQNLKDLDQGVVSIFFANILNDEPIIIYGDGEQLRDFIYIKDVVDAWMLAVDNSKTYGQVFNLGMGKSHSINELTDKVLAAFGQSRATYPVRYADLRPGDQRYMIADVTKASQFLDWHPQIQLEEGIDMTSNWIGLK
jgi:UDP-glucose 4-epimerase